MLKCSGDCGSDGNLIGSLSGESPVKPLTIELWNY